VGLISLNVFVGAYNKSCVWLIELKCICLKQKQYGKYTPQKLKGTTLKHKWPMWKSDLNKKRVQHALQSVMLKYA